MVSLWIDAMLKQSPKKRLVLCVSESEPDLEFRKVYLTLPDKFAAKSGYLRVLDESGEDYLYPAKYFVSVKVPTKSEPALQLAAR